MCGFQPNACTCYTPLPHAGTTQDTAIVGKIHPSGAAKKREKRAERKRKTAGAPWMTGCAMPGGARHHATSRAISDSLSPSTVLSRWSFISRGQEKTSERRRREKVERERGEGSRRATSRTSGFCGVSWSALLSAVSLSTVAGSIVVVHTRPASIICEVSSCTYERRSAISMSLSSSRGLFGCDRQQNLMRDLTADIWIVKKIYLLLNLFIFIVHLL